MPTHADSDLVRMRAFVAAVMGGFRMSAAPPADLVRRNHLGPIAYRMGMTEFRAEYAAASIVAARRVTLVREIAGALRARGVRLALAKGIAFAGRLYPDPAERPMNDIDLLVPRPMLPEAIRAMQELGFTRVGRARGLSGHYHAVEFARGDMMVELHRGIVQHQRANIRMGDVWKRSTVDPAMGGAERLDPVDDLLFAAVHIARNDLSVPVLAYVDVARLWDRLGQPEKGRLARRAAWFRVRRALHVVLSLTDLLRSATAGRPATRGGHLLPSTDEVLLGARAPRLLQIGHKLLLMDGPRDVVGLGFAWSSALVDGMLRGR